MAYKTEKKKGKIIYSKEAKAELKFYDRFRKIKSPFQITGRKIGNSIVINYKENSLRNFWRNAPIYPPAWIKKIEGNTLEVQRVNTDGETFKQILLSLQKTGYSVRVIPSY
jgi:hypothetical protein